MIANNIAEWRSLVLDRDGHICQLCGMKVGIADHIIPRKLDNSLLLDTDNGRTLCSKCHAKCGSKVYTLSPSCIQCGQEDSSKYKFKLHKSDRNVVWVHYDTFKSVSEYACSRGITRVEALQELVVSGLYYPAQIGSIKFNLSANNRTVMWLHKLTFNKVREYADRYDMTIAEAIETLLRRALSMSKDNS